MGSGFSMVFVRQLIHSKWRTPPVIFSLKKERISVRSGGRAPTRTLKISLSIYRYCYRKQRETYSRYYLIIFIQSSKYAGCKSSDMQGAGIDVKQSSITFLCRIEPGLQGESHSYHKNLRLSIQGR